MQLCVESQISMKVMSTKSYQKVFDSIKNPKISSLNLRTWYPIQNQNVPWGDIKPFGVNFSQKWPRRPILVGKEGVERNKWTPKGSNVLAGYKLMLSRFLKFQFQHLVVKFYNLVGILVTFSKFFLKNLLERVGNKLWWSKHEKIGVLGSWMVIL